MSFVLAGHEKMIGKSSGWRHHDMRGERVTQSTNRYRIFSGRKWKTTRMHEEEKRALERNRGAHGNGKIERTCASERNPRSPRVSRERAQNLQCRFRVQSRWKAAPPALMHLKAHPCTSKYQAGARKSNRKHVNSPRKRLNACRTRAKSAHLSRKLKKQKGIAI